MMNTETNTTGAEQIYAALQRAVPREVQFTVVVNLNEVTEKFELDSITIDPTLTEVAGSYIEANVIAMIESLNRNAAAIQDLTP